MINHQYQDEIERFGEMKERKRSCKTIKDKTEQYVK